MQSASTVWAEQYWSTSRLSIPDAICQLPRRWRTKDCHAETAVHEAKGALQRMFLDLLSYYTQFTIFAAKIAIFLQKRMRSYEKSPYYMRK